MEWLQLAWAWGQVWLANAWAEQVWKAPLAAVQSFIDTGGPVLYLLLGITVALWTLIGERYWFIFWTYRRRMKRWIAEWRQRAEQQSWHAQRIRQGVIAEANSQLGLTVPIIRMLIAICPLCGLLGTVTGMVEVFDVMALKGTSDAKAMASGIYRATIPTMAGMVVALSGLYFGTRLTRLTQRETARLADQLKFSQGTADAT